MKIQRTFQHHEDENRYLDPNKANDTAEDWNVIVVIQLQRISHLNIAQKYIFYFILGHSKNNAVYHQRAH